jgi:hypothetical protein
MAIVVVIADIAFHIKPIIAAMALRTALRSILALTEGSLAFTAAAALTAETAALLIPGSAVFTAGITLIVGRPPVLVVLPAIARPHTVILEAAPWAGAPASAQFATAIPAAVLGHELAAVAIARAAGAAGFVTFRLIPAIAPVFASGATSAHVVGAV